MGKGKVRILDSVQSSPLTNMANKLERTWRSEEGFFGTWQDVSEDKIVKLSEDGFSKNPEMARRESQELLCHIEVQNCV